MKIVLSLIFAVLLAVINVPVSSSHRNNQLHQYLTLLEIVEQERIQEAQSDEIGPHFNRDQISRMLKRDGLLALQRKCKKISGDDNEYAKSMEEREQVTVCIANWMESEEVLDSFNNAKLTKDFKPFIKKICTNRYFNGFFGCIDTYISGVSGCYFPNEIEMIRKMNKIYKNMLELICTNDQNDFALYDVNGAGQRCLESSQVEIMTCANKAIYSVAKRILEKWIENEHFKFEMEPEDCKAFDAVKSCFVSSVENCTNPKVMNMVSSAFQIIRRETKCAN